MTTQLCYNVRKGKGLFFFRFLSFRLHPMLCAQHTVTKPDPNLQQSIPSVLELLHHLANGSV